MDRIVLFLDLVAWCLLGAGFIFQVSVLWLNHKAGWNEHEFQPDFYLILTGALLWLASGWLL